jgi:hypothetical protein
MPWIKVDAELPRHRKTLALAAELGQHRWYAAGLLHDIWGWAIEHAKDGQIDPERQSESLARTIGARRDQAARYLVALKKVGWIDPDNRLHEWDEWGGQLVIDKEKDATRNRLKREHRKYGHVLSIEGCPLCPRETSSGRPPLRPMDRPMDVRGTGQGTSTGASGGRSGGRPGVDKPDVDVSPYPQTQDADTGWAERRAEELVAQASGPWRDVLAALHARAQGEGAVQSFVTYLGAARLEQRDDECVLLVPNALHQEWIARRYREQLLEVLGVDELAIEIEVRA